MTALSWASISEQLRAIGVEVPVTAPQGNGDPARTDHVPPPNLMCRRSSDRHAPIN